MREHTESNDVLEPLGDCMVPSGILSGALVEIWHMGEDDSESILLFDLGELLDQPVHLVTWITESGPTLEISGVANVGIQ